MCIDNVYRHVYRQVYRHVYRHECRHVYRQVYRHVYGHADRQVCRHVYTHVCRHVCRHANRHAHRCLHSYYTMTFKPAMQQGAGPVWRPSASTRVAQSWPDRTFYRAPHRTFDRACRRARRVFHGPAARDSTVTLAVNRAMAHNLPRPWRTTIIR